MAYISDINNFTVPTSFKKERCTIGDMIQCYLQEGDMTVALNTKQKDNEGRHYYGVNPDGSLIYDPRYGNIKEYLKYPVPARWVLGKVVFYPNKGIFIVFKQSDVFYPLGKAEDYVEKYTKIKLRPDSRIFFKPMGAKMITDKRILKNLFREFAAKKVATIAKRQKFYLYDEIFDETLGSP